MVLVNKAKTIQVHRPFHALDQCIAYANRNNTMNSAVCYVLSPEKRLLLGDLNSMGCSANGWEMLPSINRHYLEENQSDDVSKGSYQGRGVYIAVQYVYL